MSILEKIEEFVGENDGWSEFEWETLRDGGVEIPGVGTAVNVASHGGEGQGDELWQVFRIGDKFFRKSGYYSSYDGSDWDSELEEVEPYQKVVTFYRSV